MVMGKFYESGWNHLRAQHLVAFSSICFDGQGPISSGGSTSCALMETRSGQKAR